MKKGSFFQILSLSLVAAFSNISTNAEETDWYEDEQTERVESYTEENITQDIEEKDWYENEQTVDEYEIDQSDNDTTDTEICVDYEDNIISCE